MSCHGCYYCNDSSLLYPCNMCIRQGMHPNDAIDQYKEMPDIGYYGLTSQEYDNIQYLKCCVDNAKSKEWADGISFALSIIYRDNKEED